MGLKPIDDIAQQISKQAVIEKILCSFKWPEPAGTSEKYAKRVSTLVCGSGPALGLLQIWAKGMAPSPIKLTVSLTVPSI